MYGSVLGLAVNWSKLIPAVTSQRLRREKNCTMHSFTVIIHAGSSLSPSRSLKHGYRPAVNCITPPRNKLYHGLHIQRALFNVSYTKRVYAARRVHKLTHQHAARRVYAARRAHKLPHSPNQYAACSGLFINLQSPVSRWIQCLHQEYNAYGRRDE